jgi:3-phenylpropionate/cinnamic acid dioxygenase small subunit
MAMADRDTAYEVEQFLYREARLLDEERLHEWLDLFTEDARYFMPVRQTIQGRPAGVYEEDEFAVALIRDDKEFLTKRVLRLDSGLAHAETPPSRTRHLVTNVEVIVDGGDDEVIVHSNFVLFQGRRDRMSYQFYGKREDRLRRVDGAWKIARRKVVLDHVVLPRGLSVLF